MSGFLAGLAATLIAAVPFTVGWLLLHHLHHLPAGTHTWLRRAAIILMYLSGAVLAASAVGGWADDLIRWIALIGHGVAAPIPYTFVVICCLILGFALVAGLIWVPDDKVAMIAIAVPILLALPAGGLIHSLYLLVNHPAVALAHHLNHALGG